MIIEVFIILDEENPFSYPPSENLEDAIKLGRKFLEKESFWVQKIEVDCDDQKVRQAMIRNLFELENYCWDPPFKVLESHFVESVS